MSKLLKLPSGSLGSSQPKKPTEEPDAGFSTSIGSVIDVLSEGIIEGLIGDKARAIYIDNTPLENPNGTRNFKGVTIRTRRGFNVQNAVPDLDEITQEVSINTEIKHNTPLTRTIINDQLDAIRVRLGVQLQEQDEDGSVEGRSVTFKIFTREGNASFKLRAERTIKGRYSTLTEFEYQFGVNNQNGTVDSFQIKIEKVDEDSTDQRKTEVLRWSSYSEIIRAKLTYANTAFVNLDFEAEQFQSVPTRSYRVGGIICRIPSNATVQPNRRLVFNGLWDGNFINPGVAINDPVWQLYEVLTNKRWGLGVYIDESLIDKWSLYQCSVYNNQLVPDGLGGNEPRFQCSTVLQTKEKALSVIEALCSACNMKPFWADGVVQFWQDRPGDVAYQFTSADVENGQFSYSRTALRTRFTTVYVTWNDPDDFYNQAIEVVDDVKGANKYGVRETDTVAYGCFSRGQAIRAGKHLLYTSLNQVETVSFVAKANYSYCRPGEIIQISDPGKAKVRAGGKILDCYLDSVSGYWVIKTDSPVRIEPGATVTYTATNNTLVTILLVNSANETNNLLYLSVPPSAMPLTDSNWVVRSPSLSPALYRIVDVEPDASNQTKVKITAAQYDPGKYGNIENGLEIYTPPTRITAPTVVNQPTNVTGGINTQVVGGLTSRTLTATWYYPLDLYGRPDQFVTRYYVEYKQGANGVWGNTTITSNLFQDFPIRTLGVYQIRVASIDTNNKTSLWTYSPFIYVDNVNLVGTFNNRNTAVFA